MIKKYLLPTVIITCESHFALDDFYPDVTALFIQGQKGFIMIFRGQENIF